VVLRLTAAYLLSLVSMAIGECTKKKVGKRMCPSLRAFARANGKVVTVDMVAIKSAKTPEQVGTIGEYWVKTCLNYRNTLYPSLVKHESMNAMDRRFFDRATFDCATSHLCSLMLPRRIKVGPLEKLNEIVLFAGDMLALPKYEFERRFSLKELVEGGAQIKTARSRIRTLVALLRDEGSNGTIVEARRTANNHGEPKLPPKVTTKGTLKKELKIDFWHELDVKYTLDGLKCKKIGTPGRERMWTWAELGINGCKALQQLLLDLAEAPPGGSKNPGTQKHRSAVMRLNTALISAWGFTTNPIRNVGKLRTQCLFSISYSTDMDLKRKPGTVPYREGDGQGINQSGNDRAQQDYDDEINEHYRSRVGY